MKGWGFEVQDFHYGDLPCPDKKNRRQENPKVDFGTHWKIVG